MDTIWLSVSALSKKIKDCLEGHFKTVFIEGEISNFRPSSAGHLYFTLKDKDASISAVMFKRKTASLNFIPADGLKVRATGTVSVYAVRGTYQINVDALEEAGEGDILALLEKLKKKLAAEGLFAEEKKRPLPAWPWHVAVVTSATGAALRDILNVLNRRAPKMRVTVAPSPVQGVEAAAIIAARIRQINEWKLGDVIIIGRGGGSLEDLLPFSEEEVVRAVAASEIPVVSAVGHEIDWALSDFAADLRAPTPSAAAELVSRNHGEEKEFIVRSLYEMERHTRQRIERARLLLKPFDKNNLEFSFRSLIQPHLVRFDDARENLILNFRDQLRTRRERLTRALTILETASPNAVLARGYALLHRKPEGSLIKKSEELSGGEAVEITFSDGSALAHIDSVKSLPKNKETQLGGEI